MLQSERVEFFQFIKNIKPEFFSSVFVIDMGSLDAAGNTAFLFDDANYIGVDVSVGPNVDLVSKAPHELALPDNTFDVVVSGNYFERDSNYAETIKNMYRMLKPGGLLMFSCSTVAALKDEVKATSNLFSTVVQDLEGSLGLTEADIRSVLDIDDFFKEYQFSFGCQAHEMYFYGVKNGDWIKRYNYSTAVNRSLLSSMLRKLTETNSNLAKTNELLLDGIKFKIDSMETRGIVLDQELENLNYKAGLLCQTRSWKDSIFFGRLKKLVKLSLKLVKKPLLAIDFIRSVRRNGVRIALSSAYQVAISPPALRPPVTIDFKDVVILTRDHCLYVAQLIKTNLSKVGIHAEIITSQPARYQNKLHFVICPQIYSKLPDHYISFQMEQSVNSRWFTDEYFSVLEKSYAVFDYSLRNISFLQESGLSFQKTHYMPISYNFEGDVESNKEPFLYDVIFYGDSNCERRQEALNALKKQYSVKVINNLYGEDLKSELKRAKIIVNLHYYEGALLETTRLYECLSLGLSVVSERGVDMEHHSNLEEVVEFFEQGDFEALVSIVGLLLNNKKEAASKARQIENTLKSQPNWFEFYFMRFLLSVDVISFDEFYAVAGKNIVFGSEFVCLGLPESVERYRSFLNEDINYIHYFPGLRHHIGWVGCALSYKFIMKKSKEQGFKRITVCEDDVEFLNGWENRYLDAISYLEYLNEQGVDWNIFAGLISEINEKTEVARLTQWRETEYIHINKMVSMVFNIYNESFFNVLINWNEQNRHQETNQIDRYVESTTSLQVVTTLPYIVGHKENHMSTLWGRKNAFYNAYFAKSVKVLSEKVQLFKSKSNSLRS